MGFFDKLFAKITGSSLSASAPKVLKEPQSRAVGLTATFTGPSGPVVQVSDAEVSSRVKDYAFILETDPPALKTADRWWEEESSKRRARDETDKAYAWLLPFIPLEIAKLEPLSKILPWGPSRASNIAKELRALIRERRREKQPYTELLLALYGTSLMADLSDSLGFEGTQPRNMAQFVSLSELQAVQWTYATLGYLCSNSLSKTDIKWLVEEFGEPVEHQSFNTLFPHIQRNAIARYCWSELRRVNEASYSLGRQPQSMGEWLAALAKRNIGYYKEWHERVTARKIQLAELEAGLELAWAATDDVFVVADIETTGLNAEADEVIELAAVRVNAAGVVLAEFSMLVRAAQPIPTLITELTGISQTDIDRKGQPLKRVMQEFLSFIGSHPVFFHNAPFDKGFLKQASARTKVKFTNVVHDTLPMARRAWPSLGTYKLAALAEHVGAEAPSHRALSDVKVTLAVLLAARTKVRLDSAAPCSENSLVNQ